MRKQFISLLFVIIANMLGFAIAGCIPLHKFDVDLSSVGSAVCGFSGTILGLLIAVLTINISIKSDYINKYKRYGYFKAMLTLHLLTFVELSVMLIFGFFCFFKNINMPILYINISMLISSLILLILIVTQSVLISQHS